MSSPLPPPSLSLFPHSPLPPLHSTPLPHQNTLTLTDLIPSSPTTCHYLINHPSHPLLLVRSINIETSRSISVYPNPISEAYHIDIISTKTITTRSRLKLKVKVKSRQSRVLERGGYREVTSMHGHGKHDDGHVSLIRVSMHGHGVI